ncbi:hypothetical protein M3484_22245 [Pseudomonas sp. GX19020]|uniref:thermonuclease family protein n=1 Tax=Pseudomonas sp. GX19020 TaxID=2942277 RepID=UPI002019F9DA|nr:hypothetical protein [Pseudomonas sp. GX19020]MCL4069282.1 hypothetical protein [Pseudomonas sp. GX19020]
MKKLTGRAGRGVRRTADRVDRCQVSVRWCERDLQCRLRVDDSGDFSTFMRKPRSYPRKQYRRSNSFRSVKWRIRRATWGIGAVFAVGFIAVAVIGGGASDRNYSSSSVSAPSARLIDRVTRVRDGDTIVVGLIPIRIANLDCAESGTFSGERATRRVKQLVNGQTLTCRLEGRKSYDREVGVCSLPDGRDLGEIMIAEGACKRW